MHMNELQQSMGAELMLDSLHRLGIEYIFSNLGTDHASIIEAAARFQQLGRPCPKFILCPHENVAIHMAAGYAAITGRGQGVLVHVDVGTAGTAVGMHNSFRSRLPVLLMAGKSPYTLRGELVGSRDNYAHFVQDPFDIEGLVRPFSKWQYSLHTATNTHEVFRRAYSVMHSDPPGPVFLTLPREVLAETPAAPSPQFDEPEYGHVAHDGVSPQMASAIAEEIMNASNPILITSYLGRTREAVEALEEFVMLAGVRVYDSHAVRLNLRHDSPCFGGFDTEDGLKDADYGLLVDVDVPWLPKFTQPSTKTRWTHIDLDTIKKDFPMWGFPSHRRVQASSAIVLKQLAAIIREEADGAYQERVAARLSTWKEERRVAQEKLAAEAARTGTRDAVSVDYFCAQLGSRLRASDVIFSEAVRSTPAVSNHIPRTQPLTFFASNGSGLGFGAPMALGAKLADPSTRVVHIVGDGGFHFNTPSSVYAVAQQYNLPTLTVVLDNGGWSAVKQATLRVHKSGAAKESNEFQARLLGQVRDFGKVGEGFGAYSEILEDPQEAGAAIDRCLRAVDSGRSAILTVRVDRI